MSRILTINAGSTSVKVTLVGPADEALTQTSLLPDTPDELRAALGEFIDGEFSGVDAVAHRIVHGGPRTHPVVVDDAVRRELAGLGEFAPLHTGPALAALDTAWECIDRPHVACFDTAFHATLPAAAATYALPEEWRERYGLRRYGFHGLSHAYAARRAAALLHRSARLVTCHLGGGASLAAVLHGRSVDTTMGFTPLEGLVMNTRSGDVDPGLVLWLARQPELTVAAVEQGLEHRSGLRGLAGHDATLGGLYDDARSGDARARLALEVYVHRLAGGIARMTAALGGLDAVVFTGGIGENMPQLRHDVADRLGYLGLDIDLLINSTSNGDAVVSPDGARAAVVVVHAREDVEMARAARLTL